MLGKHTSALVNDKIYKIAFHGRADSEAVVRDQIIPLNEEETTYLVRSVTIQVAPIPSS